MASRSPLAPSIDAAQLQSSVTPDVGLATLSVTAPVWTILVIADHFSPVWLRSPMPFAPFPQSHVTAGTDTCGTINKRKGWSFQGRELFACQYL